VLGEGEGGEEMCTYMCVCVWVVKGQVHQQVHTSHVDKFCATFQTNNVLRGVKGFQCKHFTSGGCEFHRGTLRPPTCSCAGRHATLIRCSWYQIGKLKLKYRTVKVFLNLKKSVSGRTAGEMVVGDGSVSFLLGNVTPLKLSGGVEMGQEDGDRLGGTRGN